MYTQQTIIVTK